MVPQASCAELCGLDGLRLVLGMVRGPNSHTAKLASHQMGLSLEEEMPKAEAKVILSSCWLKATFQLHYQQHPLLRMGLWVVTTVLHTPEVGVDS